MAGAALLGVAGAGRRSGIRTSRASALVEDSKQIRIEQARELSAHLALASHQGGYKVALIEPADALNWNAANALLKTLEEPPPRTVLILVAQQPVAAAGHHPQPLPADPDPGTRAGADAANGSPPRSAPVPGMRCWT